MTEAMEGKSVYWLFISQPQQYTLPSLVTAQV
jgi:hypothetical protein